MLVNRVDVETVERFKAMGAVKVGCIVLDRYNWSSGMAVSEPNDDIVHFFDAAGLEIGYWTVVSPWFGPVIFAPGRREWHPYSLNRAKFEPLG